MNIKPLHVAIAAWMNGPEVCSIEADAARASLIPSIGISTRCIYASYKLKKKKKTLLQQVKLKLGNS